MAKEGMGIIMGRLSEKPVLHTAKEACAVSVGFGAQGIRGRNLMSTSISLHRSFLKIGHFWQVSYSLTYCSHTVPVCGYTQPEPFQCETITRSFLCQDSQPGLFFPASQ